MSYLNKITDRESLAKVVDEAKRVGKVVGYTSGHFDIIHPGHVDYLANAKKECDLLVVGINSDSSSKQLKGPTRPINSVTARLRVLAALASVDYVFEYDELNNNVNISVIKPNLYMKAGDYDRSKLSSAKIIEDLGGEVRFIPFIKGYSTTSIVQTCQGQVLTEFTYKIPNAKPAIILDRDGCIVEHVDYLHRPEDVKLMPGVVEGLKKLSKEFRLVIATNQPGIGMGYFGLQDFYKTNLQMLKLLSKEGILIDKIYFSPYTKADNAECRKPNIGMGLKAKHDLNLDLTKCYVVGDTSTDILFGNNLGCRTIQVKTGKEENLYQEAKADFIANDLSEAAEWILGQ